MPALPAGLPTRPPGGIGTQEAEQAATKQISGMDKALLTGLEAE